MTVFMETVRLTKSRPRNSQSECLELQEDNLVGLKVLITLLTKRVTYITSCTEQCPATIQFLHFLHNVINLYIDNAVFTIYKMIIYIQDIIRHTASK